MATVTDINDAQRTQQLFELLDPIYDESRALARRVAGSNAEGDDLFQDAVVRAMAKVQSLRDPSSFRFWFYRILLTVNRSRYRRSLWRRIVPLDASPDITDPVGDDGSEWEDKRSSAVRATQALATLPNVQREAVVLFEIHGFSIEEVADLQKVSLSAVKSRVSRGRDRLRTHYEKLGLAPPMTTDVNNQISQLPSNPTTRNQEGAIR
ncbi:MAG: RNA polymerase sigma factor [Myxococcales bacterium]|nr:RNA polymerase sigma factor [Myxococcales bacterium]